MVGKKAARAIPTCSLAEATLLSALGNIGAPFQQFGRQAGRRHRRSGGQRGGIQAERGSGLADEDRDGVLELIARGSNVNVLGARLFELRGGQVHVFPGSDAALKTALRELQRLFERRRHWYQTAASAHPVRAGSGNPGPAPRAGSGGSFPDPRPRLAPVRGWIARFAGRFPRRPPRRRHLPRGLRSE